jgi:hypothetical protein
MSLKDGSRVANQMFSAFPEMALTGRKMGTAPLFSMVVFLAENIFEQRRSHF